MTAERFREYVQSTGATVCRWASNGNCVPNDVMQEMHEQGVVTKAQVVATRNARDLETAQFLREYRERQQPATEEERTEMRAAFGEGATVVDVISGRETRL